MPDRPLRISLVNDYAVVVAGLARMLEPFADRVEVVELVAGTPAADPEAPAPAAADVALYDAFGQTQGLPRRIPEVLDDTRAERLVIYSWNAQPRLVEDALAQGAAGYLAKGLGAAELVAALERVDAGERVVVTGEPDPDLAEGDWPGRAEGLTSRESEIIALIAQGLSNQDIADRAFLSINSVKSYIRSSYRKMAVDSRSRAVLWAIEHGFRPDQVRIRPRYDDNP